MWQCETCGEVHGIDGPCPNREKVITRLRSEVERLQGELESHGMPDGECSWIKTCRDAEDERDQASRERDTLARDRDDWRRIADDEKLAAATTVGEVTEMLQAAKLGGMSVHAYDFVTRALARLTQPVEAGAAPTTCKHGKVGYCEACHVEFYP